MVQPVDVFEELEFIYCPSSDVSAELAHYVEGLGAEVVFAIEAFDTRVAMLRLTVDGPKLLLAQHLHGEQPVLVYRVPDLDAAEADLARRGVGFSPRFEFPHGDATELDVPGPQRIAVYQRTRPERAAEIEGRMDF
ncbi:MAG: hypothetical protein JWN29_3022 [Acidimicrobiales bacterium]|nr:hypothetical protein [Acidimicrobiales bacterium]